MLLYKNTLILQKIYYNLLTSLSWGGKDLRLNRQKKSEISIIIYINLIYYFIMRKIYSLFLTALLSMVAFAANAVNVTINVDDPSRVTVKVNYTEQEIVQGDNSFDVPEYMPVSIEAKDGYFLTSVVRKSTSANENIYYMKSCNIYVNSSHEGETWTVTSVNADDARDGSCQIWVDDASKVRMTRSSTSASVDNLVNGEWVDVKYIKASELPLQIGSVDYSTPLYQVKLDGETVEPQYGSFSVTPGENSKIEIFANYPDEDVAVKFSYANEESKGFITGVKVDGTDVTNYNDEDFTVKLGKKIEITGNTTDYKLNSFTVNGRSESFYGSYQFTVSGETAITVDAQKYAMVNATLDIDNPDNVVVYKGSSYDNTVITGLKAGENAIELSETNPKISIKANSGCYITSVTSVTGEGDDANTETYSADYNNSYNITVAEGMVIKVVSGAITRDKTAMIYVDDVTKARYGHSFSRSDRSSIDLANGYNEIEFYDGDIPAMISFYNPSSVSAYKNDKPIDPDYTGGTSYTLNELADGDVVKVFLAGAPSTYNVTFDVTGSAANATVTRDKIKAVEDWNAGFQTLQGTEVSIKAAEGYNMEASIGEDVLTPDESGNCTFTVDADTNVKVVISSTSGIKDISNGNAGGNGDIYNLQGVLLKKGAASVDAENLPAGIYVINGKKVVKR